MAEATAGPVGSTTVTKAVTVLEHLAAAPDGLGITELTRLLGTQRAPLYRILESLMAHQLVRRDDQKRYLLGAGTLALARSYTAQFPNTVEALLSDLAQEVGMTATLISVDGDVLTTVVSTAPRSSGDYIVTPPGYRHADVAISPRVALHASRPATPDDSAGVLEARRLGYAVGRGEAISTVFGGAAMVPGTEQTATPFIVGIISIRPVDEGAIGAPLLRTAELIAVAMRSRS